MKASLLPLPCKRSAFHFVAIFLCSLPLSFSADEPAQESPLSAEDTRKLQTQKIIVTNETFRQSFEPYIASKLPVFITSDAVLNAWHVLLEESVARLEGRQSEVLAELLRHLWKELPASASKVPGDPKIRDAAKRRATLVLAVAMHLLGEPAPGMDSETEALAKDEAKRVEAATGSGKPLWLGPPDPGFRELDYSRFAPRGFYVRTQRLQRYFRSVAWLQAIPFRVANQEELLAALLTANALLGKSGDWRLPEPFAAFYSSWHGFVGCGDDLDLASIAYSARDLADLTPGTSLAYTISSLVQEAKEYPRGLINDHQTEPPSDAQIAQQLQIRILPAARLRDVVLLQKTSDIRTLAGPAHPSGMQVAAALGSALAGEWLKSHAKAAAADLVFKTRDQWKAEQPHPYQPAPIYDDYLQCLSTLVDAPEKDAPDFMRSDAWQRKSCGTLLAGWTQMRRTFILQAKTMVVYMGLSKMEPGFVEPEPDFFHRLGELSERTLQLLEKSKGMESNSETEILTELEQVRDGYRRLAAQTKHDVSEFYEALSPLERGFERLQRFGLPAGVTQSPPGAPQATPSPVDENKTIPPSADNIALYKEERSKWCRDVADFADKVLTNLSSSKDHERDTLIQRLAIPDQSSLRQRWAGFNGMVLRLESLAHKQLRKVPFTERERGFIRNFGLTLASAMFYDGNSYLTPRDDAMKIVDILSGPDGCFHAAAGRPHALYVLYPWQGKEVLCIGSVLPYHEFTDTARLTDETWKQKLDGPADQRPAVPDWYAPLLGKEGMWEQPPPR